MGNIASTTLYAHSHNSHWDFSASDMLLDQMEKQTCVPATSPWKETASSYCALVLTMMAALLTGNLTGSLGQPKKTPIFVDATCQTDDEVFRELIINRDWQPCHVDSKSVVDDDNHSCTTETTELFTDAESDDFEQNFDDGNSEWDDAGSTAQNMLHAICDACDSCADCDYGTQAEQLLLLTAIVCAESNDSSSIYLEDYLCTCGECPQYKEIRHDVTLTAKISGRQTQSTIRILQAFSTYNEVLGYSDDMIPAARECLRIWCGDEDKAFKSFVALYDDVPRLCDPPSSD